MTDAFYTENTKDWKCGTEVTEGEGETAWKYTPTCAFGVPEGNKWADLSGGSDADAWKGALNTKFGTASRTAPAEKDAAATTKTWVWWTAAIEKDGDVAVPADT